MWSTSMVRRVAARRVLSAAVRCNYTAPRPLPAGVQEIDSVPRTPSWSLTELHQDGAVFDQNESVLDDVKLRELAELCHLHVDENQLPLLLRDVESIIQCTKTIQAVTLNENVDDMYVNSAFDLGTAPLREDVVTEGNVVERVLANAAERSGNFFKVPKVLQD